MICGALIGGLSSCNQQRDRMAWAFAREVASGFRAMSPATRNNTAAVK